MFLPSLSLVLLLVLSSCSTGIVEAKTDRNMAHPHNGKLSPYKPGDFDSHKKLQKSDEAQLAKDQPVMKQMGGGEGGKAICIQDVDAPRAAVWNQILRLDDYVGKVSKLKECRNYFLQRHRDGKSTIKTKMVVGVLPGYAYEYYCDHTYHPKQNSLVWTLDYEKTSDFDDVAGHWHLEDHPTKQGATRVFYACDIRFKNAVPGPVMGFLQKTALRQATSWVKRESEKKPNGVPPPSFGFK